MSSKKLMTFVSVPAGESFAAGGRAIYHPSHEASTVSEPQGVFECMHKRGDCFAVAAGDSLHAGRAGAGGGAGDERSGGSGGWFWREFRHESGGESRSGSKCGQRGQDAGAREDYGGDD
jgi:hypothetical protein